MALVAVLALCASSATAAPPCAGADIYIAAHQDDTLLFQSPDLLEDVRGNRCVQTVFTTAGDAGKGAAYWEGREAGAEAAYAEMAGVADVWQGSTVELAGHQIHKETLVGRPGVSILYLRLPDGGVNGEGFAMYGDQSLRKLWRGGNGEGAPTIGEIEADDGSARYTYSELIATLAAAIQSSASHQVLTQNYLAPQVGPDHSDHAVTGRFVKAAAEALPGSFGGNRLVAFEGYEVALEPKKPANVFGSLLEAKESAFAAYVPHDSACGVDEDCGAEPYPAWLHRQYVSAERTKGVVANAGLEQTVGASSFVALSGAASSAENGGPLGYSWTQVGGPPVVLDGANTIAPTLVTPPHPTVLTFALSVSQGVIASAADLVRVRVPGASPNPTAVAGPDQSVAASARVGLDGSASWDPEGLPLSYDWAQTGGPPVALGDPGSSRPSFTAPAGAAASTLTFSLVVANGAQASAPATVRVAVAAAPPPPPPGAPTSDNRAPTSDNRAPTSDNRAPAADKRAPEKPSDDGKSAEPGQTRGALVRKRVRLIVGRRARRVVRIEGNATARSCRGRLPVGALCRINHAGNVVVESRHSLSRAGIFHLKVRFAAGAQPLKRPLKVVIRRPK
ncbi:MAG: PIG-L family deacetylase [Solirubrobacterales bacterium]